MITDSQKTVTPSDEEKEKRTAEGRSGAVAENACRCEETSKMTPRELLGLMMKDLAFWKRTKKE